MKLTAILDEKDEKIIELLCQGFPPKQIAHKLWMSGAAVRKRLWNLRKYYKCDTTIQLILLLKEVA